MPGWVSTSDVDTSEPRWQFMDRIVEAQQRNTCLPLSNETQQSRLHDTTRLVSYPLALDQLLDRGLIADRVEVRIMLCVRATLLPAVDRESEVTDRVTPPAAVWQTVVTFVTYWPGIRR